MKIDLRHMIAAATFLACASILSVGLYAAEKTELLRPDLPYKADRSNPVTHDVDFSVIVTPPYHCKVLRVWFPVPQSDYAQQVKGSTFSTFPLNVEPEIATEPKFGNRFAYFQFDHPQGAQIIRHRFTATVWDLHWNLKVEKVAVIDQWPASFDSYLQPQSLSDGEKFRLVLKEIVPESAGPGRDLVRVMKWIDENLKYDHVDASLRADAEHAFTRLGGHCSDYHGLCATMGQSLGYPARVTYGLGLFPKNSPSHCKVEAFLPPHGWVSFDISETQKMVKKIRADEKLGSGEKERLSAAARRRLLAGFRENSWLMLTKGTDYQLVPKAAGPVRVVRTAYVEADGEPLPDPDPANAEKREFAWMTSHAYKADKEFKLPFKDVTTLEAGE